ncbi:MAG TPA: GAF domain-containing sensor histidine kinase [Anaerolineales bacterium]|nr:GAF domain-containing sensor histidine kinase [Anaerolineales bacterium]
MALLTREQLEERLAALHRASLELVGDLSLDTVLERIVNLAREQVDAAYAALGVVNTQGNLVQFIQVGMSEEEVKRTGQPPVGKGLLGAMGKERCTVRVANVQTDERAAGYPPGHPKMISFLGVPIMSGEELLGQIYLTDKKGHPEFTQADAHVIETLAAYAAIAISNARLYQDLVGRDEALRQRNQDLSLLNDVAAALAGSLNSEEILDQTLTRVIAYLGVEAGEIFLREDGDRELRIALHRGEYMEAFLTKDRFRLGEGFIGIVAETGKPLVSIDLKSDMRYLRSAVVAAGFNYMACIPLMARGSVVGVMSVASQRERRFDEREINLLTAIGAWAGITIENARLHRQAQRVAILEERERIGMDLHDGIIQSIYAVGLALEYARATIEDDTKQSQYKIEQAINGLNKTIRDIRAYILDLRPRQFVGEDLVVGLQRLIDEYRKNTLAEATLYAPADGLVGLPGSHTTALFHICQEALANVAKHSQARRVRVHLWTTKDRVLLEVADNGRGFDLRKMSVTLGHGLSNMHIRARKVGGDVEITAAPGEGTTVLAWVPRRA